MSGKGGITGIGGNTGIPGIGGTTRIALPLYSKTGGMTGMTEKGGTFYLIPENVLNGWNYQIAIY